MMRQLNTANEASFRPDYDDLGLEQFATSVAALADDNISPLRALEKAIAGFAENLNAMYGPDTYSADRLLHEKATELGFHDFREFQTRLIRLIGERMIELHVSRLSIMRQSHTGHA